MQTHAEDGTSDRHHSSANAPISPNYGDDFNFDDLFAHPDPSDKGHSNSGLVSSDEGTAFAASPLSPTLTNNLLLLNANLQNPMQPSPCPMHRVKDTCPLSEHHKAIHTTNGREALGPPSSPIPIPRSKAALMRRRQRKTTCLSSPFPPIHSPPLPLLPASTRLLRTDPLRIPPPSTRRPPLVFKSFFSFESSLEEGNSIQDIAMEPALASSQVLPCFLHSADSVNSFPYPVQRHVPGSVAQ
ncbi:hypothetical protein ACEQ8H_008397 [Pleosporales sp. CAS-2024a]